MASFHFAPRRAASLAAIAGALMLVACGGGDSNGSSSTPTQTTQAIDVLPCFAQTVIPGRSLESVVLPDVVTMDLNVANGYPNGRRLEDPVVDETIAAAFLDLTKYSPLVLANIPLDPSGNDEPLPGVFPYLAEAHGGAPAVTGGAGFVFRTDAPSAYTRVDRMGDPAIATVLIATNDKTAYNDDNPTVDKTLKWLPVIKDDLTNLTKALQDDFKAKGLKMCANGTS
ncbi:MAG: hypothetical protein JOY99_00445 [Sphingomonadaceae bacterium]|nr:hypothetical protein [Sphingomonadaceae bacterium]